MLVRICCGVVEIFFFFKQKTAYEMRISDWSSDVCSSDLATNFIISSHAFCLICAPCPNQAASRRWSSLRARRWWSTYSVTLLSNPQAVPRLEAYSATLPPPSSGECTALTARSLDTEVRRAGTESVRTSGSRRDHSPKKTNNKPHKM